MSKGVPIILGIIVALFASFMLVGNMPVTVEDFEGNLTVDGNLNVTGTGEFGGDVEMNHNYILGSDFSHWLHFTIEGGKTDELLSMAGAGTMIQDRHFHRITLAVNTAPGEGKSVAVCLHNGIGHLNVTVSDAETSAWSQTTEFDWDVSAQSLEIVYTQTAGGATTKAFVTIKYHYKETE